MTRAKAATMALGGRPGRKHKGKNMTAAQRKKSGKRGMLHMSSSVAALGESAACQERATHTRAEAATRNAAA